MSLKRNPLSWKWIAGLMLAVSFGLSNTAHSALCKYLDVTVPNVKRDLADGNELITPSVGLFCENFTQTLWRCYYNDPLYPADPMPSKWRTTIRVTNLSDTPLSRTFNVNMGPLNCGSMEIVDLGPGLTASANCTRDEVPVVGNELSSNMWELRIPSSSWEDFTGEFKFRALVREVSNVGCN